MSHRIYVAGAWVAACVIVAACGSEDGGSNASSAGGPAADGGASSTSSGGSTSSASSSGASSSSSSGSSGGTTSGAPGTSFAGDRDPSFGQNGVATVPGRKGDDWLDCIVRQSSGKLVVIGRNDDAIVSYGNSHADVVLLRLDATGALDPTFGDGGKRLHALGSVVSPRAAAVQSDDKIVVVGEAVLFGVKETLLVMRFNADGSLDTTFGGGKGYALDSEGTATGVIVAPDGKIVVSAEDLAYKLSLVRYLPDGTRDLAFGTGGVASLAVLSVGFASGVARQSDGKLLAMGSAIQNSEGKYRLLVARFNDDGSLDTTFAGGTGRILRSSTLSSSSLFGRSIGLDATDGILIGADQESSRLIRFTKDGALEAWYGAGGTLVTPGASVLTMAVDPDGKVVTPRSGGLLARWTPAGLDASFGTGGTATGFTTGAAVVYRASDGTYFAGTSGPYQSSVPSTIKLGHVGSDGVLDATFGPEGKVETGSGASREMMTTMAVQSDGKILAGGTAIGEGFNGIRPFFARFTNDGAPDTAFGTGGVVDAQPPGGGSFTRFTLLPNGKIVAPTAVQFAAMKLTQFDASGALDTTFGTGGTATATTAGSPQESNVVAQDASGRLIVMGSASYMPAVVRFSADGKVDASFGTNGSFVKMAPGLGTPQSLTAIAIRSDGKIVGGGRAGDGAFVVQLDDKGALDPAFDADGWLTVKERFSVDQVIALAEGGTLFAGVKTAPPEVVVGRLTPSGALDAAFGAGGLAKEAASSGGKASIGVQPDGKVLVVTGILAAGGARQDLLALRYTTAGVLDPSFGDGGRRRITLSAGVDGAEALSLLPDGTALVAGYTWSATGGTDAMLLRLR